MTNGTHIKLTLDRLGIIICSLRMLHYVLFQELLLYHTEPRELSFVPHEPRELFAPHKAYRASIAPQFVLR